MCGGGEGGIDSKAKKKVPHLMPRLLVKIKT